MTALHGHHLVISQDLIVFWPLFIGNVILNAPSQCQLHQKVISSMPLSLRNKNLTVIAQYNL